MAQKPQIDAFGAISLTAFAVLLAFNQVIIKVVNEGLQPIFFAGLRSLGGAIVIFAWMRLRGIALTLPKGTIGPGLLMGVLFTVEFVCLFVALDLTSVTRSSVIFYTMPMWMALGAHFFIEGDRLTPLKSVGLILAFIGVVVALTLRGDSSETSLLGDLLALMGALGWAGLALLARGSKLREVRPEVQLLWQLAISAPLLLLAALFFGPLLRGPEWIHWAGLGFQIVVIVSAGFLFWLWLLSIYQPSSVAAFSFLSPVFGVLLGWLVLGEEVGFGIVLALLLVCAGLVLINRPARAA
ncbi:DMT family transporter [Gymnodinialimonas ulvae]|uniref:DMT family transporter n=1 Tax=Gymnodinialimonas ulvae TaxID=3126504 RepID=UPI0030ABBFE8